MYFNLFIILMISLPLSFINYHYIKSKYREHKYKKQQKNKKRNI